MDLCHPWASCRDPAASLVLRSSLGYVLCPSRGIDAERRQSRRRQGHRRRGTRPRGLRRAGRQRRGQGRGELEENLAEKPARIMAIGTSRRADDTVAPADRVVGDILWHVCSLVLRGTDCVPGRGRGQRRVPAGAPGRVRADERRDPHPVRHRAGRPARRRAAPAAGLRRAAQAGGPEAGPGEARPDAPGHGPGPRGVPPAGRCRDRPSTGTAAATSSPPRPRRCGASWSSRPAANDAASAAAGASRVDLDRPSSLDRGRAEDVLALDEALDRARRPATPRRPSWSSSASSPA